MTTVDNVLRAGEALATFGEVRQLRPDLGGSRMTSTERFFATATGGCRHLRQCSHLYDKEVVEVGADDPRPLCDLTEKELSGLGRTYHDDLDAAFEYYKQPVQSRARVKELIADVEWDQIWTPYSNSYIALARDGRGVTWIQKTIVYLTPNDGVELPEYAAGHPEGKHPDRSNEWGPTCPVTFIKHPKSGRCEDCGQQSA